ncbi:WXG100 family type VII secretion target [Streptacidiphilus melanogenes]|uniref:WXG100-like domain-containing protein n=1 Tax=Streptacidiphilus melanogenes TaxID=411235 RepID=UPI0005AB4554|nr:WXG100 family type VII secretion target [Streptacidiphilus melanogenes]
MAIELPGEVAQFLQFIGINWPQINEDKVREFASHVREFATNIQDTHQQATGTVSDMSQHYQGNSYELLVSKWAHLSQGHMQDLLDACQVLATALDAGADYIVAMKLDCIAELIALAASFIADQAAAVATLGLAEAAEALIVEAAEKAVDFLEQQLVQYIIGQVIEAALTPLLGVVEKAVAGMTYSALEDMLGVSGSGPGDGFMIHPDNLKAHAQLFAVHAETVQGHAQVLSGRLAGMSFE